MRASSSMTAAGVALALSRSRAIVACSVHTALFHALLSKNTTLKAQRYLNAARGRLRMKWQLHQLDTREWAKVIGVGIGVAILTAAFMIIGLKSGISPLPRPLGLAFAETVLGRSLPLPVGLIFHTAWVTAFTALYVVLFRDTLTFGRALWLGHRALVNGSRVLFPARRMGLSWARNKPQSDRWIRYPTSIVRVFLMGFVSTSLRPTPRASHQGIAQVSSTSLPLWPILLKKS